MHLTYCCRASARDGRSHQHNWKIRKRAWSHVYISTVALAFLANVQKGKSLKIQPDCAQQPKVCIATPTGNVLEPPNYMPPDTWHTAEVPMVLSSLEGICCLLYAGSQGMLCNYSGCVKTGDNFSKDIVYIITHSFHFGQCANRSDFILSTWPLIWHNTMETGCWGLVIDIILWKWVWLNMLLCILL